MEPFSLYLHIPYCYHKCPYCDFNTYALAKIPEQEYVESLLIELDKRASQKEWKGRPLSSIFFGGGTPSVLSEQSLDKILTLARTLFPPISDSIEITLEANPTDINSEYAFGLKQCGINRLSLGAQSMKQEKLQALGRQHTPEQIHAAVLNARGAGITQVSLDLMYGAPQETLKSLAEDLQTILDLKPDHLSCYTLTIEKGTPFYIAFKKKLLTVPIQDEVAEMMLFINQTLKNAGFVRYEISNFSLPEKYSRHNLSYWNARDYLGLGAGAHSMLQVRNEDTHVKRWSNFALPQKYQAEIATHGTAVSWSEALDQRQAMFEFIFLGLRKIQGVDVQEFEKRFYQPVTQAYGEVIKKLQSQELLQSEPGTLKLTDKGTFFADAVTAEFA